MKIVYTLEEVPAILNQSIFLAGPTARSPEVKSWRLEALKILKKQKFNGVVFVPEFRDNIRPKHWSLKKQAGWEWKCLDAAHIVLFWIPRNLETLPGFTTNTEFGFYIKSGKVVFGSPPGAYKMGYLKLLAKRFGVKHFASLKHAIEAALKRLKKSPSEALPPNAKMVFKGKLFEIWQWPQKMYDGSVATFEKLKRPDTVDVIATVNGKIIIQEQKQPDKNAFMSLPGGRVDEGEKPLACAKRELLEETGYASNSWSLWKKVAPRHSMIYNLHYYVARDCKFKKPQELDPGEKIKIKFVTFEELLMLSENPRFRNIDLVNHFLRMRLNPALRKKFEKLLFT